LEEKTKQNKTLQRERIKLENGILHSEISSDNSGKRSKNCSHSSLNLWEDLRDSCIDKTRTGCCQKGADREGGAVLHNEKYRI
jgi:hypothetical protein